MDLVGALYSGTIFTMACRFTNEPIITRSAAAARSNARVPLEVVKNIDNDGNSVPNVLRLKQYWQQMNTDLAIHGADDRETSNTLPADGCRRAGRAMP